MAGSEPSRSLVKLCDDIEAVASSTKAFKPELAADLGQGGRDNMKLSLDGLGLARRGVQQHLADEDITMGVRTRVAIFDGLRMAKRGIALTIGEAQEATTLTAASIQALEELKANVDGFVSAAQLELGAGSSLRTAIGRLKSSGLEGIDGLIKAFESAADKAQHITQDFDDPAALSVARRMRNLEAETRPLVEAIQPTDTKNWEGFDPNQDVLWETRMVDISEVVLQALQDARAECGGWAVCADAAESLKKSDHQAAQIAADALNIASTRLRDEGLTAGADCLAQIRAADVPYDADLDIAPLLRNASKWLRDFAGVAAILRDAAGGGRLVKNFAQEELLQAAKCFEDGDGSQSRIQAGDAFRKALAKAQNEKDRDALNLVERDVRQVLGINSWVSDSGTIPPPYALDDPIICPENVHPNCSTMANEASGDVHDRQTEKEGRGEKKGGCCVLS